MSVEMVREDEEYRHEGFKKNKKPLNAGGDSLRGDCGQEHIELQVATVQCQQLQAKGFTGKTVPLNY